MEANIIGLVIIVSIIGFLLSGILGFILGYTTGSNRAEDAMMKTLEKKAEELKQKENNSVSVDLPKFNSKELLESAFAEAIKIAEEKERQKAKVWVK